jgi:hypothetical protein
VLVATGDVEPMRSPRKTVRRASPRAVAVGTWCSKRGSVKRSRSGSATQSWTPCRTSESDVAYSEWAMPRPAVMRFISPARTSDLVPTVSRCSMVPENSQDTVCRPVCGWPGTAMLGVDGP